MNQPKKIDGKMQHHWIVMLDHKGMIYVSEHAQLREEGASIALGDIVKMHAAVIEHAHKKVHQFLEQHAESAEDYNEGLDFFAECVRQACEKLDDVRLVEILRERERTGDTDPLSGLAGVVEAAKAVVEREKNEQGALPTSELDSLRARLAGIGVEV
jgi:hypothetical protein